MSRRPWNDGSAPALERDLRHAIAGEVRFDAGSRAAYATDGRALEAARALVAWSHSRPANWVGTLNLI